MSSSPISLYHFSSQKEKSNVDWLTPSSLNTNLHVIVQTLSYSVQTRLTRIWSRYCHNPLSPTSTCCRTARVLSVSLSVLLLYESKSSGIFHVTLICSCECIGVWHKHHRGSSITYCSLLSFWMCGDFVLYMGFSQTLMHFCGYDLCRKFQSSLPSRMIQHGITYASCIIIFQYFSLQILFLLRFTSVSSLLKNRQRKLYIRKKNSQRLNAAKLEDAT